MKIDYIKLQNYRQYKNEEIEFDLESDKDITVIKGDNGAGKSNLLNSVTWALYEEETHITSENEGLHLPNTEKISEMDEGDTCEVFVEIMLRDRRDKKHNVKRTLTFEKTGPGKVRELSGTKEFSYARETGNDMEVMTNPEHHLNLNLPSDISKYFFFDGEQLNRYFETSSESRIRDAVFNISQLEVLENTIYHLNQMKNDFLSEKDDLDPNIEEKRKKVEALESQKGEMEENFSEVERQKDDVSERVNQLRQELKDAPEAGEIQKNIEDLEEEREGLEQNLDEKLEDKMESIVKEGPFVLAEKAIGYGYDELEDKAESDIPSEYKEDFIEKLLRDKTCICGRDISESEHSHEREEVKEYLKQASALSDLEDVIIRGETVLERLESKRSKFEQGQNEYNEKISEKRQKITDINEEIDEKKKDLEDFEVDRIKNKQRKLGKLEDKEEKLIEKRTMAKKKVEEKEKKLDAARTELEDELSKKDEFKEMQEIYSFCDQTEIAAEEIKDEIMQEVRQEIQEKTEKWFFDLIWKEETYESIQIDENYNISLLDNHERNSLNTLSAGETQTLALSFMAALNTVSGFYAPIIIDTPIGRISPNIKKNIAENLPSYMGDRQLILLVTGSEYTEDFRDSIKDDVANEYKIEFDEDIEGSKAEVKPYGK